MCLCDKKCSFNVRFVSNLCSYREFVLFYCNLSYYIPYHTYSPLYLMAADPHPHTLQQYSLRKDIL